MNVTGIETKDKQKRGAEVQKISGPNNKCWRRKRGTWRSKGGTFVKMGPKKGKD